MPRKTYEIPQKPQLTFSPLLHDFWGLSCSFHSNCLLPPTTNSVVILFLSSVQVILVPFIGVLSRLSFPVLLAFISFWSLICTSSWGPGLTGYRPNSIVEIQGKTVNADLCLRRLVLQHSLAMFKRDEQREAYDSSCDTREHKEQLSERAARWISE
jgi:hypothetical protein